MPATPHLLWASLTAVSGSHRSQNHECSEAVACSSLDQAALRIAGHGNSEGTQPWKGLCALHRSAQKYRPTASYLQICNSPSSTCRRIGDMRLFVWHLCCVPESLRLWSSRGPVIADEAALGPPRPPSTGERALAQTSCSPAWAPA